MKKLFVIMFLFSILSLNASEQSHNPLSINADSAVELKARLHEINQLLRSEITLMPNDNLPVLDEYGRTSNRLPLISQVHNDRKKIAEEIKQNKIELLRQKANIEQLLKQSGHCSS